MLQALRKHIAFLFLLVLFIGGVLAHQATLPTMEGYDETLHYNYIVRLRADNRLPDRDTELTNGTRQESSQPPLTYWADAMLMNLFNVPPDKADPLTELDGVRNMWFTPPDEWNRRDNLNVYYHGSGEVVFGHPDIVTGDRVARLMSLIFGVLAVIGAYGTAREFFDNRQAWALAATAIFAFAPQMLNISAVVSNDVGAAAFAALIVWQTMSLLRRGASPLRLIVIGLLLGMAGLSKVNALLVAPGVGLALLIDWRARKVSPWRLLVNAALIGLPFALLFAPWVAYGWINYGSPLGLEAHNIFAHPDLPAPNIAQVAVALVQVYASYWGRFGGGGIWMNPVVYILLSVIVPLSAASYVLGARYLRWQSRTVQRGVVLLVMALANFAGLLDWLVRLFAIAPGIQGRLMYPGHAANALLLAGGLFLLDRRLGCRYSRAIRLYAVAVTAAAGLILAPLDIYAAFAPPTLLTQAQLPALHSSPIDFDHTIRLLGYTQSSPIIRDGSLHTMTLCWQVLAPATYPAVLAVKVLDGATSVGDRTTIPGLGHFNSSLWKPGDLFCDAVDIVLRQPLHAGQVYDVIAVILDWHATTPDGAPIDVPRIAQVVSPAGDQSNTISGNWQHTGISFPGFADLDGMALTGTPGPGQSLRLDLWWKVTGKTAENWSQFIHLIGPGMGVILADKVPRAGRYPTWAWSAGEHFTDEWQLQLPANLAPGEYNIEIGFYRQDSGNRLPATIDGKAVPDDSASLLKFQVK